MRRTYSEVGGGGYSRIYSSIIHLIAYDTMVYSIAIEKSEEDCKHEVNSHLQSSL